MMYIMYIGLHRSAHSVLRLRSGGTRPMTGMRAGIPAIHIEADDTGAANVLKAIQSRPKGAAGTRQA
jgi:hypothetical protein